MRSERTQEIIRLRQKGKTLEEIGTVFDVSRERVRQILVKNGGPTLTEIRLYAEQRRKTHERSIRRLIREQFNTEGTLTVSQLGQAVGVNEKDIRRLVPYDLRSRLLTSGRHSSVKQWSDHEIFDALVLAATYEYPLTAAGYDELLRVGEVVGPSVPLIYQRFEGWRDACDQAGVETGIARPNYDSRWSDADLLRSVSGYMQQPGSTGAAHRYPAWRKLHAPDSPSLATLRNRLGKWSNIKGMAMEFQITQQQVPGLGSEASRLDDILAATMDVTTRQKTWTSAKSLLDMGPLSETGIRGSTSLALGYVQSGKTTSIMALIAAAADEGYEVVIALLGTTNLLLEQNRTRVEDTLGIGKRQDYVWVGEVNPSGARGRQAVATHLDRGRKLFIPVLKHAGRIRALAEVGKVIGDRPVLIVDDEADQASLNTSQESQSRTYEALLELRNAVPNHFYVQYTATPYAPLLLDADDLLHPQHVEFLQPGPGYTGGKQFFVDRADAVVRNVPALEEQATRQAPLELPQSLVQALASFVAGAAILLQDHAVNAPISMLVHSTARNDVQARYEFLINRALKQWRTETSVDRIPKAVMDEVQRLYANGVPKLHHKEFTNALQRVLREAHLWLVNSASALKTVDWTISPVHILVGGNKLDRGFTVEGLTVTYMNRPASLQVDTLEQRARAFGYRGDLLPYCQFFASHRTVRSLRDVVFTELDLRARLQEHVQAGGDISSWADEVGFLMPTGMKPTRDAVVSALSRSTFGWHSERTPSFDNGDIAANWHALSSIRLLNSPYVNYGRLSHRTTTISVRRAHELLRKWCGPERGPGWSRPDIMLGLERLSPEHAELTLVFLEEQDRPRVRKWDKSIGFINLFQGRDSSFIQDPALSYPGDRNVPDIGLNPNRPAIQVHRVTRRGHSDDIAVLAVYLGDRHIVRKV